MRIDNQALESRQIRGLAGKVNNNRCTLQWLWPAEVEAVYIHKTRADLPHDEPASLQGMKLYTKDEYKANNGYHDRLEDIGAVRYTIYVTELSAGETILYRQQEGSNQHTVRGAKAKIYYSIQYKSGLFKKHKTVQIQVMSEVPLAKDVLCYVKKQGGPPARLEDGTLYPFVEDFPPGRTVLPAIEIGKDEMIRLFFTDGRHYGQLFELIPE